MSKQNLRNAQKEFNAVKQMYRSLADQLGWDPKPAPFVSINHDDLDELTTAISNGRELITEAETELERQAALQNAQTATAVAEPPDEEALPDTPVVDEIDFTLPVGSNSETGPETIRMTGAERAAIVETAPISIEPPPLPQPRRSSAYGFTAAVLISFGIVFAVSMGLGNVAIAIALIVLAAACGRWAVRRLTEALRQMSMMNRIVRVGFVLAVAAFVFAGIGPATASSWMWAMSILVVGLVVDRLIGRPTVEVTFEK